MSGIDYKNPETSSLANIGKRGLAKHLVRRIRASPLCGKISTSCMNNNSCQGGMKRIDSYEIMIMRPCRVSLERCLLPSSDVSIAWDVQKKKLSDQTVQLLFRTVEFSGSEHGEEEVKDDTTDARTLTENSNVCTKGRVRHSKFSVQFKSQVVAYLLSHSLNGTSAKFGGVSKRTLSMWRKEEKLNTDSRGEIPVKTEELKLKALKCLKETGKQETSRMLQIPVPSSSDLELSNPTSPYKPVNKLQPLVGDRYVMTNLPQDRSKLRDIWELLVAPEDVNGEEVYSCLSCDRRFRGKSAKHHAWSHVDHIQTPQIDHKCHVCHFISQSNDCLRRHITKVHKKKEGAKR